MEEKLALLGAARGGYENEIDENIKNCGYCWTGWTYYLNNDCKELLDRQFKRDSYFHIFVHDIYKPKNQSFHKGRGYVWYKIRVEKYKYTTSTDKRCTAMRDREYRHSLAACLNEGIIRITPKKWNEFIDYFEDALISECYEYYPWRSQASPFLYIIDE